MTTVKNGSYLLYGDYSTVEKAEALLRTTIEQIMSNGGGILVIPEDAPVGFHPRNLVPQTPGKPGVTVVDNRLGARATFLPAVGKPWSGGATLSGATVERDLDQSLPPAYTATAQHYITRSTGGTSSVSMKLARRVEAQTQGGAAKKTVTFHVPTLRGLYVDQLLHVSGGFESYKGGQRVEVTELGLESDGSPYFKATADPRFRHPKGSIVFSKNIVNALTIREATHGDNQSMSLIVDRTTYGSGDTFCTHNTLSYSGDIFSGGGDEGGIGTTVELFHSIARCFWGHVEGDPMPQANGTTLIRYAATHNASSAQPIPAFAPDTLGTSRPLINMNPDKHITDGAVIVVKANTPPEKEGTKLRESPDRSQALLIGSADTKWDSGVIGKFIAITGRILSDGGGARNDASEMYVQKEVLFGNHIAARDLHRWWRITGLEKRNDGRWHLYVERPAWDRDAKAHTGPTLILKANYTTVTDKEKVLSYIIAPGAIVADVRRAVAGTRSSHSGTATISDERLIAVAPSVPGASLDFEDGDEITNPPGPDPWIPVGSRVRHYHNFPSSKNTSASFESINQGQIQVGSALSIIGKGNSKRKDGRPDYNAAIEVKASTVNVLNVTAPVKSSLIMCKARMGDYGIFLGGDIRAAGLVFAGAVEQGPAVHFKQPMAGEKRSNHTIQWDWSSSETGKSGNAKLSAKPNSGVFTLAGGTGVDLSGQDVRRQVGLSATDTPARNLRGIDHPVPEKATSVLIKFPGATPEINEKYAVFVECSWETSRGITSKTVTGFTIEFGSKPPKGATLDWFIVR